MADINRELSPIERKVYECPNCAYRFLPAERCPECGQLVTYHKLNPIMQERVDMVRAMETVARAVNDEDIFMSWLSLGVADGDIDSETTDYVIAKDYCEDEEDFADLMDCFLRIMKRAYKSGGLYAGDVVSNIGEEVE